MNKLVKTMKLFGDLSPEEKQEFLNELKETNTETSGDKPQDTLKEKETDKGGSETETSFKEETPTEDVAKTTTESEVKEQEQTQPKEAQVETEKADNVDKQENDNADNMVVGEDVGDTYVAEGRDINDFVTKDDLQKLLDQMQAKIDEKDNIIKGLQEKVEQATSQKEELENKYEKQSFGDFYQRFNSSEEKPREKSVSFKDYFNQYLKK